MPGQDKTSPGRIRVLRAYGGHDWQLIVIFRFSSRSGYALDRLSYNLKAPAAAEKSCARQALSSKLFYRAKMPSIATPVVHGNRPAARMPPSWMTALGGREEAQSALLAFGGHETGPAVCRGLSSRSGYAFDRLFRNLKAPAAASRCGRGKRVSLHWTNAFKRSLLSGQDATDRSPRRPWEPPGGSNAA